MEGTFGVPEPFFHICIAAPSLGDIQRSSFQDVLWLDNALTSDRSSTASHPPWPRLMVNDKHADYLCHARPSGRKDGYLLTTFSQKSWNYRPMILSSSLTHSTYGHRVLGSGMAARLAYSISAGFESSEHAREVVTAGPESSKTRSYRKAPIARSKPHSSSFDRRPYALPSPYEKARSTPSTYLVRP